MNIKDIETFSKKIDGKIYFEYDLKKTNWFKSSFEIAFENQFQFDFVNTDNELC